MSLNVALHLPRRSQNPTRHPTPLFTCFLAKSPVPRTLVLKVSQVRTTLAKPQVVLGGFFPIIQGEEALFSPCFFRRPPQGLNLKPPWASCSAGARPLVQQPSQRILDVVRPY